MQPSSWRRDPADTYKNHPRKSRMIIIASQSPSGLLQPPHLTTGYQAESIRRLADALGMTIVREDEDEECGSGSGGRPQFRPMMDEARSGRKPFRAIIAYDRGRFAAGAANFTKYARELRAPESSCSACGTSRQEAPQRPGTRRSGGGGRPESPGGPAPAATGKRAEAI